MGPSNDVRVFEYQDQLVLELYETDDQGDLAVVSYHFGYDDDGRTVHPVDQIAQPHQGVVYDALHDEQFQLAAGKLD